MTIALTPLGPDMDTDGYTTPPGSGSGDGMYSPSPAPTHHTSTGSGYGGSAHAGGGYGGGSTGSGGYGGLPGPTPSVSVATTPPTHQSLPSTGPNVFLIAGLGVVALLMGVGMIRISRRTRPATPGVDTGRHRTAQG